MILLLSTANTKIVSLCAILVCCYISGCSAKDNITTGEFISDGVDYLESSEKKFQMGFFPHERTSEHGRYVGIWYTMDPNTIVWVANRDNPVMGFTGVLTVAEDGNIKIRSKDGSSDLSTTTEGASPRALKLLDNGNAVVLNIESGNILWQSFKNPTDTFLPGMIMEPNIILQSWKSLEDPGSGSFMFQPISGTNRYSILNGSTTYIWKSGNMSTDSFDKNQISIKTSYLLSNTTTEKRTITKCTSINTCTSSYEPYMVIDPYSRLVMNSSGKIQFFSWPKTKNQWVLDWQEPKDACSIYKVCGSFGMCNENNNSSLCSCMDGFEPISLDDTKAGCKRISELGENHTKDTFVNKTMIGMDDTTLPFFTLKNQSCIKECLEATCIKECLGNSQCLAYSSQNKGGTWDARRDRKQGCWFWESEPLNLQENGEHNISFRVSEYFKGTCSNTSTCCTYHRCEGCKLLSLQGICVDALFGCP